MADKNKTDNDGPQKGSGGSGSQITGDRWRGLKVSGVDLTLGDGDRQAPIDLERRAELALERFENIAREVESLHSVSPPPSSLSDEEYRRERHKVLTKFLLMEVEQLRDLGLIAAPKLFSAVLFTLSMLLRSAPDGGSLELDLPAAAKWLLTKEDVPEQEPLETDRARIEHIEEGAGGLDSLVLRLPPGARFQVNASAFGDQAEFANGFSDLLTSLGLAIRCDHGRGLARLRYVDGGFTLIAHDWEAWNELEGPADLEALRVVETPELIRKPLSDTEGYALRFDLLPPPLVYSRESLRLRLQQWLDELFEIAVHKGGALILDEARDKELGAANAEFQDRLTAVLERTGLGLRTKDGRIAELVVEGKEFQYRFYDERAKTWAMESVGEEYRGGKFPRLNVELRGAACPGQVDLAVAPTLNDLGLSRESIEALVASDDHEEARRRLAAARQHHGLDTLQLAFNVYQRAIGGVVDGDDSPLQPDEKLALTQRLNDVARSLCAVMVHGEAHGHLVMSGNDANYFNLRAPLTLGSSKRPKHSLGTVLPLLGLRPAPPTKK